MIGDDKKMVKEVMESDLENLVKNSPLLLVDYFGVWCVPCQDQHKILDEFEKKNGNEVTIVCVDIDKNEKLAERMKINAVPMLFFFKNGKFAKKLRGCHQLSEIEDILKQIKS